jgi:hypothetical protein
MNSKTLRWEDERLVTQGRKKLWDTAGQRIELLDGTANPKLLKFLFPGLEAPPPIRVKRNLFTVQVRDRTFSRYSLLAADDAPLLRAEIAQFLERLAASGRKVLVVTYKALRPLFTGEDPTSPRLPLSGKAFGCDITHFGRIRGSNAFGECDTVVVIGRNELGFKEAEDLAMALTFDDAVEITRIKADEAGHEGYGIEQRPYLVRNGSAATAKVSFHPDPIVQAIVEQKREGETLQALDRIRPVRSRQLKEFFHLCSIPLPDVEVDRLVTWEALAGNRRLNTLLEMCAAGSLKALPLSAPWLAKRFPDLWKTPKAAKRWLEHNKINRLVYDINDLSKPHFANKISIRRMGLSSEGSTHGMPELGPGGWGFVEYRLTGHRGGRPPGALVQGGCDPAAAIAQALGVDPEDIIVLEAAPEAESGVKRHFGSKPTIAETENSLWPREVHIRLPFSAETAPR